MKTLFAFLVLMAFISGCSKKSSGGGGGGGSSSPSAENTVQETTVSPTGAPGDKQAGTYLATLTTINQNTVGLITGALTILKEDDLLVGDVRVSGASPNILHSQSIHIGRCPNQSYDVNADGIVDAAEAAKALGPQLIPLDGDLNAQLAEYGTYPVSDQYGNYIYSEVASYEKFLKDLKASDERPSDDITKLKFEDDLDFVDKVVIIRGVADETVLPATVASMGGLSKFQTLPIACGTLKRVDSVPGTHDDDPVSDVVPTGSTGETVGGSSGVNDGAIIPGQVEGGATAGETSGEVPGETSGETSGGNYGEDEP